MIKDQMLHQWIEVKFIHYFPMKLHLARLNWLILKNQNKINCNHEAKKKKRNGENEEGKSFCLEASMDWNLQPTWYVFSRWGRGGHIYIIFYWAQFIKFNALCFVLDKQIWAVGPKRVSANSSQDGIVFINLQIMFLLYVLILGS